MTRPTRTIPARLPGLRALPLAVLLCLLVPLDGLAADLRVAVGDLAGRGTGRKTLIRWQRQLKKLGGLQIQSTGDFKKQARAMQAQDLIPQDSRALSDVSAVLEVDVVVYGSVVRADQRTWPGSGGDDRVMLVSIYSGKDGRFVAEEIVEVPRGRLSAGVWRKAALAVEPYLGEASVLGAPEPSMRFDAVPVEPDPAPRETVRERTETPEDYAGGAGDFPLFRLHAGMALLSRDFDYTAAPESPLFAQGGIQYASAIVPGIALDLEAYPLTRVTEGAARGIGLGMRLEKVFLETEQTVTGPDGEQVVATLETSHSHVLPRLLYRHLFGSAEVVGHLGVGFLGFEIQENPEYNGVSYTYLTVGAGGHIPLGSPMMAIDVRAAVLPYIGVGDTVDELGADASSFGYRLYGGLASVVGSMSLQFGIEYTGISTSISGEGRGGRQGTESTDRYIGARLMGGYRF